MTVHKTVDKPESTALGSVLSAAGMSKAAVRSMLRLELVLVDTIAIVATAFILRATAPALGFYYDLSPALSVLPMYILFGFNGGAYSAPALELTVERIRRGLTALVIAQVGVVTIIFFIKSADHTSRLSFGITALSMILGLTAARALFGLRVARLTGGRLWNDLLLIDGALLDRIPRGAHIIRTSQLQLEPDLQNPEMLNRFGLIAKQFDRVMIASVPERHAEWAIMLKGADVDGEILMEQSNKLGAIGLNHYDGYDTLRIARKPLNLRARTQKRALDLVVTIPVLLALLPLLALIALAIKLDSRGPVLFKQTRVGRGNRMFQILKFRSMRVEQLDATGARSASRDDDRITRVGRIIRATSLDELPQLFNVLLGDMSLVGPRPHALGSLAGEQKFWEVDRTYWQRHQLKPGITGLAQIRGFRGATHETSDLTSRLQADMEYIQDWDIWRDISILVNTFQVIVHRNAY